MSFFKKMVGDSIKKAVSEAVESVVKPTVENVVKPVAQKAAETAANAINEASGKVEEVSKSDTLSVIKDAAATFVKQVEEASQKMEEDEATKDRFEAEIVATTALALFPKYTFGTIKRAEQDETDEYVLFTLTVDAKEGSMNQYRAVLEANGFTGSDQIKEKTVKDHLIQVDFSFAEELDEYCQLRYCINK